MIGGLEALLKVLDAVGDGVYAVDRERRIVYWNRAAERLTGFRQEQVLGRSCADDLLCHVSAEGSSLCVTGCPFRAALDGGANGGGANGGGANGSGADGSGADGSGADGSSAVGERDVWLRHAHGHRVPVSVSVLPLSDADGRVVGAAQVFRDRSSRSSSLKRLRELEALAYLDGLTGLGNRRFAEMALSSRLAELDRYGWPFGLLFADLDDFKELNDQHGHEDGDRILRLTAVTLENTLRPFDFAGRWGGDEFLAIVANVDGERLLAIGERFRAQVFGSALPPPDEAIRISASVGVTVASPGDTAASAVGRADRLMYRSKEAGGNRVTLG